MATLATTSAPARLPPPTPPHHLDKGKNHSTLQIGQWTIEAIKRPILNIAEIDRAEKDLNLPLPEMTFGNNLLSLSYRTDSMMAEGSGSKGHNVRISLNGLEALAEVGTGEGWEDRTGGAVLVSMAETWGKNRSQPSQLLSESPLPAKPVKPHDWTFSTCHTGRIEGSASFRPSDTHSLPLQLLSRQDPVLDRILYYEDVPLFEDELHDNGESILNARIRVMPHSFFVLYRLFLRVDNVLFRIFNIRLYHAFGSDEVIREVCGMEADYEDVKSRLEKPSDLSPLTNPNFVYQAMQSMGEASFRPSGKTKGKAWPGLGKRVEVMSLPSATSAVEESLRGMSVGDSQAIP